MRAITAFMNGVTRLNKAIGVAVSFLVFAMFVFILLEVFLRYAFNSPTMWTNELTQLMFGAYAVLSGGYLMAHRGHVNVDLIQSFLGTRMQAAVDVFTSILFFLFTLALLYFSFEMASKSISSWETSYSAWNPPIWPIKACIPIGTALLLLQGIVKLLEDIAIACNLSYYRPEDHSEHDPKGEQL
ncbi:TRAP transporter small permease subunit [Marinobacter zhanjiangensis]|uniref:TRAP transporter small permease protein n=1 Tax=Marinobacter zhanjiangensis TaxID=578215 RepID=A0ABQ3AM97_9GAMM|nr:TRAP transporter small permease subunit [Marinobacter zhanjiangensis]GGY59672.1 membrane protein [Marinobacter zhanjiangensis]